MRDVSNAVYGNEYAFGDEIKSEIWAGVGRMPAKMLVGACELSSFPCCDDSGNGFSWSHWDGIEDPLRIPSLAGIEFEPERRIIVSKWTAATVKSNSTRCKHGIHGAGCCSTCEEMEQYA